MRKFSRTRWIASIVCAGIFAGAAVVGWQRLAKKPEANVSADRASAPATATPTLGTGGSPSIPRAKIAARSHPSETAVNQEWRDFQSTYGSNLNAAFTADHRIANIRSGDAPATPAPGFRSGDRDAALARSEEILNKASELIGLNPALPLATASVRSDEISSQVEWVQSYEGVPIEPYGRVTIQLDDQGGLRGLYSSYISDPVVGNAASLNADAAIQSALPQLAFQPEHPDRLAPGQLILFAAGPQGGSSAVPLLYAYRFDIEGREVILDASSGQILSEKDQRQF